MGLFVGRRTFTVTPGAGAIEFRMRLQVSGPLAPLILKAVGDRQSEIDGFSSALCAYVERVTVPKASLLDRLHALAVFVPRFEAPDFQFGVWTSHEKDVRVAHYAVGATGLAFLETCSSMGWVLKDFDWPAWLKSEGAIDLHDDADRLATATADQLARVLTVLIRSERFVDGALAVRAESGSILNILRRAASLEAAMLAQ